MKIEDLKVFYDVAQNLSFSAAADNLFMSQSSVSKAIRRLENELNILLFTRKHSAIELTLSGRELYDNCGPFLKAYEAMLQKVQDASKMHQITLVECIPLMKFNLHELFERFRAMHTNISLDVLHYEFLEDAVKELGTYPNLYLTYSPKQYLSLYHFEKLYEDQLVVLLPEYYENRSGQISLHDIKDMDLFITSGALRKILLNYFTSSGISPRLVNITDGPRREIALRKAANGYGAAICYESDLTVYRLNFLKKYAIKEFPSNPLYLGIKNEHEVTHHEQILISLLISYAQNTETDIF